MRTSSPFLTLAVTGGLALSALIPSLYLTTVQAQDSAFPDVPTSHINVKAIQALKTDGIIEGYPDGDFKPQQNINRAEFTKILVGSIEPTPQGNSCFPDVQEEWFAPYVCEAKERGIIEGHPDGTFKPAQDINFAEASKIIANTFALEAEDQQGELWFQQYVDSLGTEKAIPLSIQFFDEEVRRDEMSEMIWRLKTNTNTKTSRSFEEIIGETFVNLNSCPELKQYFIEHTGYYYSGGLGVTTFFEDEALPFRSGGEVQLDTAVEEGDVPTSSADGASAADEFSTTTIQVEGVDEADVIKNDGQYIYLIKGNTVRIVEAYPADQMEELVSITLGEEEETFSPREMYVDGNTLTIIGSQYQDYVAFPEPTEPVVLDSLSIAPARNQRTTVYILDIADRSAPTVKRTIEFDGFHRSSRRINDTLYLIMTDYAEPIFIQDYLKHGPLTEEAEFKLPFMKDSLSGEEELISPCDQISILPKTQTLSFLIAAAIPLEDMEAETSRSVIMGEAETIYSSPNNLYVATTDWGAGYVQETYNTAVYRFALEPNSISFATKGTVPGNVLNQFSMDEHQESLRIATTKNNFTADERTNNLYVLDVENLNQVGSLEGLAPGESIFSARFIGDRAYLVTFRQVDPLFVIDLKDPAKPAVLGELKIPGFSNYLHPYDENHLIGFGREVDISDTSIDSDDFVTWSQVQGFKLGLFDVSDPNKPKELFTEVIGNNGTHSELLYNHKALLFDREKELVAFPISVYEYQDADQCQDHTYSSCPESCQAICVPSSCTSEGGITVCTTDCDGPSSCVPPELKSSQKVFEGAYIYSLNLQDGFTLRGKLNHHNETDLLELSESGYVDFTKAIQRIIYIGENLYTISQHAVKANLLEDLTELNLIELAGGPTSGGSGVDLPFMEF